MKSTLYAFAAACVAAAFLLANNSTVNAADRPRNVNVDKSGVILHGYDAVAYFKQHKPVKGNPAIKSSYQGATYLFASAGDKADFDKNPAKYVPQYGGFCAHGMSSGKTDDIDPNAFLVYKGKLYVCASQPALKEFQGNILDNIQKADDNWRRLIGS